MIVHDPPPESSLVVVPFLCDEWQPMLTPRTVDSPFPPQKEALFFGKIGLLLPLGGRNFGRSLRSLGPPQYEPSVGLNFHFEYPFF